MNKDDGDHGRTAIARPPMEKKAEAGEEKATQREGFFFFF